MSKTMKLPSSDGDYDYSLIVNVPDTMTNDEAIAAADAVIIAYTEACNQAVVADKDIPAVDGFFLAAGFTTPDEIILGP